MTKLKEISKTAFLAIGATIVFGSTLSLIEGKNILNVISDNNSSIIQNESVNQFKNTIKSSAYLNEVFSQSNKIKSLDNINEMNQFSEDTMTGAFEPNKEELKIKESLKDFGIDTNENSSIVLIDPNEGTPISKQNVDLTLEAFNLMIDNNYKPTLPDINESSLKSKNDNDIAQLKENLIHTTSEESNDIVFEESDLIYSNFELPKPPPKLDFSNSKINTVTIKLDAKNPPLAKLLDVRNESTNGYKGKKYSN